MCLRAFGPLSVSFVIPTHGDPRYLFQAVESVQAQTHPVDEIVIAVDGASDETSAAVRARYDDVIVLPAIGQLGAAGARNRGIRAATGDIIFFLDGDDLAHPKRVATTLEYMSAHRDCRAVRAPIWLFSGADDAPDEGWGMSRDFVAAGLADCVARSRERPPRNDFAYLDIHGRSLERMLEFNRGVISTTAVERELLLAAGLPPDDLRCGDDWTMFVNIARIAEWHLLPTALGFQRLHAASHTRSGGLALAAGIVDAKRRVWEVEETYRLRDYGVEYAAEIRGFLAALVRSGRRREALALLGQSLPLVPLWRDRVLLLLPGRLVDHIVRPRPKERIAQLRCSHT